MLWLQKANTQSLYQANLPVTSTNEKGAAAQASSSSIVLR